MTIIIGKQRSSSFSFLQTSINSQAEKLERAVESRQVNKSFDNKTRSFSDSSQLIILWLIEAADINIE